jgi:hypothetical protein
MRQLLRQVVPLTGLTALSIGLLVMLSGCDRTGEAETAPAAQAVDHAATDATPVDVGRAKSPGRVSAPKGPLNIVFDPPELDFGYIPPNVNKKGTIAVRNHGSAPVRIEKVSSTCKCTTLNDLDGTVIGPQESVTLEAKLQGRAMSGTRKAQIRFIFEGYPNEMLTVDLRGEVTLPVRTSPSILNLARGQATGHIVVESVLGEPFTILAANGKPPVYVDFDPDIDERQNSYILEWDLEDELAAGALPHWWIIETDHPDCPLVDAWVRHPSTLETMVTGRQWRVADRRTILGVLEPGQSTQFTVPVTNLGKEDIHAVRSLSGNVEARLVEFKHDGPEGVCTVEVTPAPDVHGAFQATLEYMGEVYTHTADVVGKVAG